MIALGTLYQLDEKCNSAKDCMQAMPFGLCNTPMYAHQNYEPAVWAIYWVRL